MTSIQWREYLSCSHLPPVTDEKALNTWISQYRDTPVSEIAETMEGIKDCLTVCAIVLLDQPMIIYHPIIHIAMQ